MDELERLKLILKNSFTGIKADMDELKDFRAQQMRSSYEMKQELDRVKEDSVSKDRVNLLKIKIGEINDSLKKIWTIEEELKKLDSKTVPKSLFDQKTKELSDEFSKRISEVKLVVGQLKEESKQFVSKNQVKDLINDINGEFNIMHRELADLKNKKHIATANEVRRRADELSKKMDILAKELLDTNKKLSTMIKKDQVEDLVKQVDKELDDIRSELNEIQKVKKYVSFVEADMVKHKELKRTEIDLADDINNLRENVNELRRDLIKNFEKKIKDVGKKEVIVREEKRAEKRAEIKKEKPAKPYRKTMILGNLLIGLAFVLIIFAIIAFFAVETAWADLLSIISIISFIVGILLRVFVIIKRK